jgi:glycosyltransferase involved in cell wall biosynthesis
MVATSSQARGGVASVLATWREAGLFERAGVRHLPTSVPGGRWRKLAIALQAWFACLRALLVAEPPIVHVHLSSFVSFWRKTPFLALTLLRGAPLVVSLHGGAFREFYAARGALVQAWIRLVMRRAWRFLVLTEQWRRWALQVEPRARVEVLPNTVAEPDPGLPSVAVEPDCLLFLGRVERDKGVFVLLDALARAHAAGAGWRLVCAGTGDVAAARAAAARAGLADEAVRFVGWVDGAAKSAWLARCAALVLPSLIENMPVVLLEAYAHAKPVIATRVGGIPDMLTDGCEGWLVEPGDAGELALALIAAWQRDGLPAMGRAARERFTAQYARERVVARVEALYAQCLTERAAARARP